MSARLADPAWRGSAVVGLTFLAALSLVLVTDDAAVVAVTIAVAALVAGAFVLAPRAAQGARRHPGVVAAVCLLGVVLAWLIATSLLGYRSPSDYPVGSFAAGHVLLAALAALAGVGGLVLIADALRARLGLGRTGPAPWQRMTASGEHPVAGFPWPAVVGFLLVIWAGVVGIGAAGAYSGWAWTHSVDLRPLLLMAVLAVGILVVIGTPLLVAALARTDHRQAETTREDERQRFAAHLHDSVLQTLALVQRNAHDPASVARLARRQEHALRSWMAGETELAGETLAAALRDAVAEVEGEDEHGITVEVSIIGDRPLDPVGEAIAAAAREALRNAARHAPGAPTFVFAEIEADRAEVFVRDDGPGFDPGTVPSERRGLRDAVAGRMAAVGGTAAIDSTPGEGTEVTLRGGTRRAR